MERFNSFSSDQIVLTKRQVSMIMASMLLFCLFVFIVGFFLGKRTIIEDFSSKVTKEALHDQIDFLLTTQSLQSSQEDGQAIIEAEPQENDIVVLKDDTLENLENIVPVTISPDLVKTAADKPVIQKNEEKIAVIEPVVKKPQYAQLIGFGTKKAAQSFVARLKKHDGPVILKTVMSKTASGKQRVWYQAITPTFDTAQELQDQLNKIKRLEHIRDKDMKIVYAK